MSPTDAQEKRADRWVMVAGHGSVDAAPDTGHVSNGVVTEAASAREALTANNAAMGKVINGLKAAGIAPKDIQTEQLQIQPRYKTFKDRGTQQIEAYVVRNRIQVKVRNLARLGDILDQVVKLGAREGSRSRSRYPMPRSARTRRARRRSRTRCIARDCWPRHRGRSSGRC